MGELLRQVYASDKLVIEVVDDFSWLYRRTEYRNYKYYNDNHLFGAIPPYHLTHCRFFVNLDGNKIKRGLKVVASGINHLYKHHFDIKKIMLPVCILYSMQNTNTEFRTWLRKSSRKQQHTTSSQMSGRPMKFRERTWCTCTRFAKATGWTSSKPDSSDTTTDHDPYN